MNTEGAFEFLVEAACAELEKTQARGAEYFNLGQLDQVRQMVDRAETVERLIVALRQVHEQWNALTPTQNPPAQPTHGTSQPTPTGSKTPQEKFRIPILMALVDMGGRGKTGLILDQVGKIMDGILNDFDRELLPARHDIRWRNTAQWERLEMVKIGYLSSNVPNGIWEITTEGRKYLIKNQEKL